MDGRPEPFVEPAEVGEVRARELYRYYLPAGSSNDSAKTAVTDTVLTALAQLATWRLDAQRAMISLMDERMQHFVAESTKTLDLEDVMYYENPEDALWAGCVSVPKAGRLCEHTINALTPPDGSHTHFEVQDLASDPRFNRLPFVCGAPHFRYYCGVPIQSPKGVNIGSFFILDGKVRSPVTEAKLRILAGLAKATMTHLETLMFTKERERILSMNYSLATYVDPERGPRKKTTKSSRVGSSRKSTIGSLRSEPVTPIMRGPVEIGSSPPQKGGSRGSENDGGEQSNNSGIRLATSRQYTSSDDDTDSLSTGSGAPDEETVRLDSFHRAAELLCSALHLEGGGGVYFVNSSSTLVTPHLKQGTERAADGLDGLASMTANGAVDILAAEHRGPVSIRPQAHPAFTQKDLLRLIRRHPKGKLFQLDADGGSASSEEMIGSSIPVAIRPNLKAHASKSERTLLHSYFPHAWQVMFLPLWDSLRSRYSAFFCYNASPYRTFSLNPDYLYCVAFCKCLTADILRLDTILADRQKGDFIASISHELRSPLHGILASCEFLLDTEPTSHQESLISMTESCARTLLDTITMVLDYSKINTFERNAEKARSLRKGRIHMSNLKGMTAQQPGLSIFGEVDLSLITEEVVEGVATGHVYKDQLRGVDTTDLGGELPLRTKEHSKDVQIIIDIEAPSHLNTSASLQNWVFVTQPGAYRRIVMNLVGNALKYTDTGYIRVELRAEPQTDYVGSLPATTTVVLTITDTGRGMSHDFLQRRLYTPFSQENILSTGTGLGLALVKAMVTSLGGEIDLRSTLGVGTQITVRLPMSRPAGQGLSTADTTPGSLVSATSTDARQEEVLSQLRHVAVGRTALLYPLIESTSNSEHGRLARQAMIRYLRDWFSFVLIDDWPVIGKPDVILVDEHHVDDLLRAFGSSITAPNSSIAVIICTTSTWQANRGFVKRIPQVEIVSHPYGPGRLARSMQRALEKLAPSIAESTTIVSLTATRSDADEESGRQGNRAVERTLLSPDDPSAAAVQIITQGAIVANANSTHAHEVLDAPSTARDDLSADGPDEFPFSPDSSEERNGETRRSSNEFPFPAGQGDDQPTKTRQNHIVPMMAETSETLGSKSIIRTQAVRVVSVVPEPSSGNATEPGGRQPRLLLVDDNKVNLRLLQAFMKKRQYRNVEIAEDGQEAVEKFRHMITATASRPSCPPDVVFMDISMPRMNGFEATRAIRVIEEEYRSRLPASSTPPSSLIIALTGLASGKDQSEAFTSGFDLFLVKPVSFKEVGRLLDNWEKSSGAAPGAEVPHGSLTSNDALAQAAS